MFLRFALILAITVTGSARDLLVACCMTGAGTCEMKRAAPAGDPNPADDCCRPASELPARSGGCCAAPDEPAPAAPGDEPAGSCCADDDADCSTHNCDAPCVAKPPAGCCGDCLCCQPSIPPARTADPVTLQLKHTAPPALLMPTDGLAARGYFAPVAVSRGPPLDRAHARALLAIWLI